MTKNFKLSLGTISIPLIICVLFLVFKAEVFKNTDLYRQFITLALAGPGLLWFTCIFIPKDKESTILAFLYWGAMIFAIFIAVATFSGR
jgi:hypothetical protein